MSYTTTYQSSISNPESFWKEKSELIAWYKKPEITLSKTDEGLDCWYADGELNTSYLALDYHIEQGRGEQTALIYDSPVTNTIEKYSYIELRDKVALFAGVLDDLGVVKGDRVILYMPMIPEAAIAMLACARIGAIHSVVFGGFAANELAVRIDDATPKVIISASCGIEVNKVIAYKPLLDQGIALAEHTPSNCVIVQREQAPCSLVEDRDLDWNSLIDQATPKDPVPVLSNDPLYILYTSGTTGKPKGVVRDNGGHAVAMRYSMEWVYGVRPGDVYWAASDVGWVVGHSYIIYAPLLTGCTTILYEGKPVKTPDAGAFWRVCEDHKVKILFSAPTAFRAIRKEDPDALLMNKYDLSSLERLYLAGERLDPPTYQWLAEKSGMPVLDHWWQTETGWAIACNPVGEELMPVKPGSATLPTVGFDVQILDQHGKPAQPNEQGNVVVKLPMPPGCLSTIWNDTGRYKRSYLETFGGYYLSGDGGYIDEDGYLFIMGRTDDVINVAGHRLSTGEMEEIVGSHHAVAECAVFGVADQLKGQVPIGLVLLKDGIDVDEEILEKELIQLVRDRVGPLACFHRAMVVDKLPKTRSGKILRKTIRQIADGEAYSIPSTIDDPTVLADLEDRFNSLGMA